MQPATHPATLLEGAASSPTCPLPLVVSQFGGRPSQRARRKVRWPSRRLRRLVREPISRQYRRRLVTPSLGGYRSVANPLADDGDMILWRLAAGAARPVLVADFQAFSSAPRLSHLVIDRAEGRPVYQVDPLEALSRDRPYISLADLAAEAVDSFGRFQPADGPAFVIGYCSAAALSMHIATLLARSREATAVLLRPTWPTTEGVQETFATLAANLGARQLSCPDLDGDPDRCVRRMEELLRVELAALAASQGLDGSAGTFGELLLTYRSWLAFLLACRNDSLAGGTVGATAVKVLTEAHGGVTVPGLAAGRFEVCPLPVLDEDNPVTPEVVELLVAQITG